MLYTAETLHKLIAIPTVAAIKEASFDAMRFLQVKAALESASRKITFLTGNDNFICESFILGAEGALLGFSTLGTREQVLMLDAVRRGDIDAGSGIGRSSAAPGRCHFRSPSDRLSGAHQGSVEDVGDFGKHHRAPTAPAGLGSRV